MIRMIGVAVLMAASGTMGYFIAITAQPTEDRELTKWAAEHVWTCAHNGYPRGMCLNGVSAIWGK
jgi:hypothetical protein